MNKKKILVISIVVIFISILIFILFPKHSENNSIINILNTNSSPSNYGSSIIDLHNEELSDKKEESINKKPEEIGDTSTRENVVTTTGTPYYSSDGWASNVLAVNDGSVVVEVYNNSDTDMIIDNNFVMCLGVSATDNTIESTTDVNNEETILPHQTRKIYLKDCGDAKYFKVGYTNMPKAWALYPIKTFMDRVNNEEQIKYEDSKDKDIFSLDATISPHIFKSLNIGTVYSRKVQDKKYQGLEITNKDKKTYPYLTLGYLKVDIYNKTDTPLKINSMDLLYKENDKVINTETIPYTAQINSKDCQYIEIPFKYFGNGIKTTIVLNSSMGKITINNPDLLFGVIQAN